MTTDNLGEGTTSAKFPRFFYDDGRRSTKGAQSRASSKRAPSTPGISFLHKGEKKDNFDEGARVFVDAAAMKEKVRQNLSKRKHTVSDYYKTSGLSQQIARSTLFEQCTLGVIAFNAVWIAVDTDHNDAEMLLDAHVVFQVAENFFCFFFSFELLVRYLSFRRKRDCMKDAWFVFDSMLVSTMVLETWALNVFALLSSGGSGGNAMGNASILRIARLLRLSRMARMARLLRAMPELMVLIKGMMAATRSVFFTLCLLILILYVFAIAFKQLCDDTDMGSKYFKDVASSMYTLLVHGALLDDVSAFSGELGSHSVVIAAIFFLFSLLAALTVMNMLIGVLCEVVSAVAATEKEEMLVSYVNGKLRQVVDLLDANGDNQISKKEFVEILENVDAARALQEVGVDVVGLIDFAEFIFMDDSVDAEEGESREKVLAFSEFMEVVLQLRGSNNATVKDVVDLRKFIRRALIQTNMQLGALQKTVRLSTANATSERLTMGASPSIYSTDKSQARSELNSPLPFGNGQAASNGRFSHASAELDSFNRTSQKYFYSVEDGGCPIPPKETPAPNLLHHRVQENERLLWGDRGSCLHGRWHPIEAGLEAEASGLRLPHAIPKQESYMKDDLYAELNALCQGNNSYHYPCIEVDVLRSQVSRLSKVLSIGLTEVNRISEGLHRETFRPPDL